MRVTIPMPRGTHSCAFDLPHSAKGQAAVLVRASSHVEWTIPRVPGGSELLLLVTCSLDSSAAASWRSEVGSVSLQFEAPQHTFSGLTIRSLKILERVPSLEPPQRWVRFVATSDSYVCRL
eukprot:c10066_g1_i1.p3 GENE.c10066_g1_i1~~c10066_g1_i1.p3  ORF type:complete len:121 (+),score=20.73 c10066_g1_i1:521-883(+)